MITKESGSSLVPRIKRKKTEESLNNCSETTEEESFRGRYCKSRSECASWPNEKTGPNINLQFDKKKFTNQEEKNFFFDKIKKKKKTELCKNWEIYHDCFYKDECCFAHGIEELRQNISLPAYKTKECKAFLETSICPFGIRCNYRHVFL